MTEGRRWTQITPDHTVPSALWGCSVSEKACAPYTTKQCVSHVKSKCVRILMRSIAQYRYTIWHHCVSIQHVDMIWTTVNIQCMCACICKIMCGIWNNLGIYPSRWPLPPALLTSLSVQWPLQVGSLNSCSGAAAEEEEWGECSCNDLYGVHHCENLCYAHPVAIHYSKFFYIHSWIVLSLPSSPACVPVG